MLSKSLSVLSILLLCGTAVFGHTWVSCANYVNGNCLGYIRNYVGRNTPTSVVDNYYTTKALGRPNDFPICAPYQNTSTYSQQYPMTVANPGDTVYVMYTPNGHSQPGDHGLQTTSRIHWTGSTTSFLNVRGDLNAGNQLASWNYSSNCAQLPTPNVASLPCTNGFTIPAGTPHGVYQFVWYWPYDRDQSQVPIGEEYFSCFDVNVGNVQVQNPPQTTAQNPTTAQNTPTGQNTNCGAGLQPCGGSCYSPSSYCCQNGQLVQISQCPANNNPTTGNPQTSQPANPQTSQGGNPTTNGGTATKPNMCATSLTDCQTFCAPATPTVCNCDPTTGARTVKCDAAVAASAGVQTFLVALSVIATFLAL